MHISTYDDDIRTRNILIRTYVEKPLVLFIVAGQSNAVGYARPSYESAAYCGSFWYWYNGAGELKPLKDPTCGFRASYQNYGSTWPAFARYFFELTHRKVCILNVAQGGAAVTNISSNTWFGEDTANTLRVNAATQYNAMKASLGNVDENFVHGGLLWIQGEAECSRIGSGSLEVQDYTDGTLDVFRFFRELTSETDLPVFMSQIGLHATAKTSPTVALGYQRVHEAQAQLAVENENVYLACTLAKSFLDAGEMTDGVHYSQHGYNLVGESIARYVANTLNL